jgi:hypothetical protein
MVRDGKLNYPYLEYNFDKNSLYFLTGILYQYMKD